MGETLPFWGESHFPGSKMQGSEGKHKPGKNSKAERGHTKASIVTSADRPSKREVRMGEIHSPA